MIKLLGSFLIKIISFLPSLSLALVVGHTLFAVTESAGILSRLSQFEVCACVRGEYVPRPRSLDGHCAFAAVDRNAGCCAELEVFCFCLHRLMGKQCSKLLEAWQCQDSQYDPRGHKAGRVSPRGQRVSRELEEAPGSHCQLLSCPKSALHQAETRKDPGVYVNFHM